MYKSEVTNHAILFADIVGSTRLYETIGDEQAKQRVVELENFLAGLVLKTGGMVVETVGDEVMCRYPDAATAVRSAVAMQEAVEGFGAGRSNALQIRMGLHYGPAIFEHGRLFGDTVNTAARMAAIAAGRQIITTQQTVDCLDDELKGIARSFDRVRVKGKAEPMQIFDLIWRHEEVTHIHSQAPAVEATSHSLSITFGSRTETLSPQNARFRIGRDDRNDLIVDREVVSRSHAGFDYLRGKFVLIDKSTNGTYLRGADGKIAYLRREVAPLTGSGCIGIGEPVDESHAFAILYVCT